jgi:hypothetical protein
MLTIRTTRIAGESLADDYEVRSGGLTVGRIYLDRASVQPHLAWYWAINGVHAGPGIMQLQDRAASLEDAKAALRENWQRWLAWAKLAELP